MKSTYLCLKTIGKKCPICEYVEGLRRKNPDEISERIFDVDLISKHNRRSKSHSKTRKIRFDTKGEDADKSERLKNRRKSRRNKANRLNEE